MAGTSRSDASSEETDELADDELSAIGERDEAHEFIDDPERHLHCGPLGCGDVVFPVDELRPR
jgi:hypothetical protein